MKTKAQIKKVYDFINHVEINNLDQMDFSYENEFFTVTPENRSSLYCPWYFIDGNLNLEEENGFFDYDDYPDLIVKFKNKKLEKELKDLFCLDESTSSVESEIFDDFVSKRVNALNKKWDSVKNNLDEQAESDKFVIKNVFKNKKLVPFEEFYKRYKLAINPPAPKPKTTIKVLSKDYTKKELEALLEKFNEDKPMGHCCDHPDCGICSPF